MPAMVGHNLANGIGHAQSVGVFAGVCYSLLYLLVLSEDYALLFGALAIFFLLGTIMIATRKLDWYRVAESRGLAP